MNKRLLALLLTLPIAVAGCSSSGGVGSSSTPTNPVTDAASTAPTDATSTPSTDAASGSASADNGGGTVPVSGSVTVYAAASLTEAFTTLKNQFQKEFPGTKVVLNFGASSDLATRITQGANADVFASASVKNMQQLGGAAVMAKNFVSNTGEIAVPPKNPAKIKKLGDLAKPGVKVATCAAAVPCGVVAASIFANAKITVKSTANPADVKSTLALVQSGEVDAGIVYVTDVRAAGKKVKGIAIAASVNTKTTYPIAQLKDAQNATGAQAWIQYVLSGAGQKVLTADGFSRP